MKKVYLSLRLDIRILAKIQLFFEQNALGRGVPRTRGELVKRALEVFAATSDAPMPQSDEQAEEILLGIGATPIENKLPNEPAVVNNSLQQMNNSESRNLSPLDLLQKRLMKNDDEN